MWGGGYVGASLNAGLVAWLLLFSFFVWFLNVGGLNNAF
jgi:hypothetical protein